MSQIQRYTARGYEVGVDDPEPYPDDLVRYSDYAALEAQVEALQRENELLKEALNDCQAQTLADLKSVAMTAAQETYGTATRWEDCMPPSWRAAKCMIEHGAIIASRATQPAPQEEPK
jgi:hypothetical protein